MFRCIKRSGGQSLVEFALTLPLIALLLGGIASFGFLLYAHVQVSNATREGARAGAQYLGGRFHYTVASGGGTCWTMRQWVENALVEYNRNSSGCPTTRNVTIHSFGRLGPMACATPTPDLNNTPDCWVLRDLEMRDPATGTWTSIEGKDASWIQQNAVGAPLMVEVDYYYNVPFLAQMFQTKAITISKAVIMRIQNN